MPAQSQMGTLSWTIDSNNHFFQQGAQEFLAIAIRSGGCSPDSAQIGAKSAEFVLSFLGESTRLLLHAPHELCFGRGKIAQTFFPLCLKPSSYESVFRLDRAILALCTFRFVASAFQRKTPLAQSCILISFELLHGKLRGFDRRRCHRFEKCVHNRPIDLHAADGQTEHASPFDDIFAGAVIAGRSGSAGVVGMQTAAALSTCGQALQQGSAFSHSPSCLVWLRMNVGINACLIGLECSPVD